MNPVTNSLSAVNRVNSGNSPKMNTSSAKVNTSSAKVDTNSSFISAPISNVSESVKKMMNGNNASDLIKPINESINSAFESDTSPYISIPIIVGLGVLIVMFIIFIIFRNQISLGLDIVWQKIKDLFGYSEPAVQPAPPSYAPDSPTPEPSSIEKILPGKKEVFNVAQDKYTYTDAEPLCKAFGAELATYDQVKEAWNKGADWCNYGWIKGQSAVYPTQQATYDKIQMGPEEQRMSCGTPGVNGGYFDNPELRFGVNCYGSKPSETNADERNQMKRNHNLTPETILYDKKVQDYKVKLDQIPINPFTSGTWSS
jgi:hypothetical protein